MEKLTYIEYNKENKHSKVIELSFTDLKNFESTKNYYIKRAERYTKRTGLVSAVDHFIDGNLFNTICFENE